MINYSKYSDYRSDFFPVRHTKKDLYSMNIRVSEEYRRKIRSIRSYDGRLGSFILSLDDYVKLVAEAHAVNVHWSTKIEGNKLSLDEVRKSSTEVMASKTRINRDPGPYQEIVNHLYSYFIDDALSLPWDLFTISSIHGLLMKDTGEECVPGSIRVDEQMQVTDGNGTVTFIACPASNVRNELQELVDWLDDSPYDPLITAILFFYQFESIHPFTEGNGRTGRTLFHVLMQEMGFERFNLCKLEDKLLGNSTIYYSLLEYTGEKQDYTPLSEFFIDCVEDAYREAVEEFSEKDLLKNMDEDSRKIALTAREKGDWFFINDAMDWVNGLSVQSVRSRLASMVGLGILEKEGKTRSTRFRFLDPFRSLKEIVRER